MKEQLVRENISRISRTTSSTPARNTAQFGVLFRKSRLHAPTPPPTFRSLLLSAPTP